MAYLTLDHVQIAMPAGEQDTARAYYRRARAAWPVIAATIAAACGDSQPRSEAPRAPAARVLGVSFADSIPYENELHTGFLRRVVVRTTAGTDTLRGVLVNGEWSAPPVVAGDSVVYGVRAEESEFPGLFAYDARTRRTRLLPPPAGWIANEVAAIAPDGRHVAYLASDGARRTVYAAVAALPEGRVVLRGPRVAPAETDAGVGVFRWLDPGSFEATISMDLRREFRLRGSLSPRRLRGDTVALPPPPVTEPA